MNKNGNKILRKINKITMQNYTGILANVNKEFVKKYFLSIFYCVIFLCRQYSDIEDNLMGCGNSRDG